MVAATFGTPADVIKTRVMNQPTDPATGRGLLYKGTFDCVKKTISEEGVTAMYKGAARFDYTDDTTITSYRC